MVDTVTWPPHKFTLPMAATMDLINASLQDLAQALHRHKNEESLPTLPRTQVQVLNDLADALSNNDDQATPNLPTAETEIEQPLDVQKQVRFHPDTREPQNKHRRSHTKHPARELRVETEEAIVIPAPELRVETPTTEPANAPHIIPDDEPTAMPTFPPQPPATPTGPHAIPPEPQPRRSPRLRRKNQAHFAATDTAVAKATKLIDEATEECIVIKLPKHFALKAINPDTGLGAKHPELRKSSDGLHWEQSFCNEIGRLFPN